jgi:hypothetical protein
VRFVFGIGLLATALVCACTSPDISAEVGTFSNAVTDVSGQFRREMSIGPGTVREGQVAALVGDRKKILQLSEACDAVGTNDRRAKISECRINDDGVLPAENSVARAATQLDLLAAYFASLDALAKAKGPTDIQNAAGAAIDAVGGLSGAIGGSGLAGFTKLLQENRAGITKAAGFAADQYRYGKLRSIVSGADASVQRIVLALADTAEANGQDPTTVAYERLTSAQDAMGQAKRNGTDAEYAAAIRAFQQAYDDFVSYRRTALIPRLSLIAETHAALRDRLAGPATPEEIILLIEKLKAIQAGFE